jgi:hypothetical protein
MIAGLVVYALNFFTGKSKNNKLANAWLASHRSLLEENFSLVGTLIPILHKSGLLTSLLHNLHIISANFRYVCKIAKKQLLALSCVCLSIYLYVCLHGAACLPLDRFSLNLILEYFLKIY